MIISLYLQDRIIKYKLPTNIVGSYVFFDDDDNNLINIDAKDGSWVLYSTKDVHVMQNNIIIDSIVLKADNYYIVEHNDISYILYVNLPTHNNMTPYFYTDLDFNISYGNESSIAFDNPYIKDMSLTFTTNKKNNKVIKINEKTAVYINNNRLKYLEYPLKYGDIIELYGLKLIFFEKYLLITNNPNRVKVNVISRLSKYNIEPEKNLSNDEINDKNLYNKNDYFSKSPRIYRVIKEKEVKLTAPPSVEEKEDMPMLLVIGPMLTMGVTSAVTLINTLNKITRGETTFKESNTEIITGIAMLVTMIVWPLLTDLYNKAASKRKTRKLRKKYLKYLDNKDKSLESEAKEQAVILGEELITIENCIQIIENKNINFWSKRVDEDDFLVVRIGTGDEKLKLKLEYSEEDFDVDDSALKDKANELAAKYKNLKNVPIGYSLYENYLTGIMGKYNDAYNFTLNILLQLLTFYSYTDLKIVIFTNHKNESNWDFVKYLNHNFDDTFGIRFFSSSVDEAKILLEYLSGEANKRIEQADKDNVLWKPYYLVIADDCDQIKRLTQFKNLTELNKNLGFTFLMIENKISNLPSKCNNFIKLDKDKSVILKKAYEEQFYFQNEIHYYIDMMHYVKTLANVPVEIDNVSSGLPESLSFLEMEKVGKVEQLNILNRWNTNESTTSLKAPVGVDNTGELMYLDLHEKYHGPHGLIAGTTGSGKSEFIITYILSMAINYSPDDVAFILIDYKGGGLAGAFENKTNNIILPHLAGTITNLDKAEMDRTLVSIDSEVKRRQAKFNEVRDAVGESTIDIYKYQALFKEGKISEPMPHLFIICDEFAELKAQQPDFMDNLISIARIGRSLGVHLILATQKPSGVVDDQIWSNTKFRVCLKVQDEADSKEMLKREEAAHIKQTGRFYLQVGYDEVFELGQSAYAGAKYYPSDVMVKTEDKSLNFLNNFGARIKNIESGNNSRGKALGEQITSIMQNIISSANSVNKRAERLWLTNISPIILCDSLKEKYKNMLTDYKIVIGEYDAPERQEQGPVIYDILNDGNTLIYGTDGTEREMLLNSIIYQASVMLNPNLINFYIVDYGSESFRKFSKLPEIGGIVFTDDDEKFNNLIKLIKTSLSQRRKKLAKFGGDYKLYRKTHDDMPLQVVIFNDYQAISEAYDFLYDEMPELIKDSERYGIIYILTGSSYSSIPSRIAQNSNNVYAFRQKDTGDFTTLLGTKTNIVPRDINGRGLFVNNGVVNEFQTSSLVDNDAKLTEFVNNFINNQIGNSQVVAKQVPTLPKIVSTEYLNGVKLNLNNLPIGISKKELELFNYDFTANIANIIITNKLENTKKFVTSLLYTLRSIPNCNLIVLDAADTLNLNKNYFNNYVTSNFDEYLDNINNYVQSLIDSNSNLGGVILINSFNKFISKIDEMKYTELVDKLKTYEKISIIIVDIASRIKNYMYESYMQPIVDDSNGIWIGPGLADQGAIHLSNVTKEMMAEQPKDMGFVITDGVANLCKLINFIDKGDEDGK